MPGRTKLTGTNPVLQREISPFTAVFTALFRLLNGFFIPVEEPGLTLRVCHNGSCIAAPPETRTGSRFKTAQQGTEQRYQEERTLRIMSFQYTTERAGTWVGYCLFDGLQRPYGNRCTCLEAADFGG